MSLLLLRVSFRVIIRIQVKMLGNDILNYSSIIANFTKILSTFKFWLANPITLSPGHHWTAYF